MGLKIAYLFLWVLASLVPSKHALHMFQQNRYEVGRFLTWIKENLKEVLLPSILPLVGFLGVLFLLSDERFYLVGCIALCLFGGIWVSQEKKKNYIKPLVYTGRVKRQIVGLLVLEILVVSWGVFQGNDIMRNLSLLMVGLLPWVFIFPMALITTPIENHVKQGYLNEAKDLLNQHRDLIKIGITGSYGKTTTKNIFQSVLSEQYRSLMTPASYNTPMGVTRTIREELKPIHQVFVSEMGADHVGDIQELMKFVQPSIGVLTAIGPQHLQTFGSIENIVKEKMEIVECLPKDGFAVLNYDNEWIRNAKITNPVEIKTYGIQEEKVDYRAINIQYHPKGSSFEAVCEEGQYPFETQLLGELNILNILSAIVVARRLDISWETIQKAVKHMKQVEHRLESKMIGGYNFIDDAFNANPSGAKMALEVLGSMPNKRIIMTPGMIELGDQQEEINYTFGSQMIGKVDEVYLIGERQTKSIYQGLVEHGFDEAHIYVYPTIQEAFQDVYQRATPQDTILLENDLPDAFNH